jgi:hypothetical protein
VLFEEERHYPHVVFEVDCFELVRIWKMGKDDRSVISPILDDIWEISLSFVSFSISLERRTTNNVAHICAKNACTNGVSQQ